MDWSHICSGVCERIGCTPEQFGSMTLTEIVCVCLDVQEERKRNNSPPAELESYIRWWHSLTPEEQLWAESYE